MSVAVCAYYDGSETHRNGKRKRITLAGYAASPAVWEDIKGKWWNVLADNSRRPSCRYLHMREANRLVGEFSSKRGWTNRGVDILLRALKSQLEAGDDSNLLVWVLPKKLATGQRPLRHHPLYAGSGVVIPVQATSLVFDWAAKMRHAGIASIISFMHDRDRRCYSELDLKTEDINEFFETQGFKVARIPWEDPHHSKSDATTMRKRLEQCRLKALKAFDELPKPVLLQCSSGIDRSAPVAAYIWQQRSKA